MSEFKLGPLNHVGIAVPDIEEACDTYRNLYNATDITTPFVTLPNAQIELIEPLNAESPIANFIAKNPKGGQHHVCFEVDDIDQAVDEMGRRGATVLGKPRIGAHGTMIIFVHPKNSNGVLIELMETPKGAH